MRSIKAKKTYDFFLSFLFIIHEMHENLIQPFILCELKESVMSLIIAFFLLKVYTILSCSKPATQKNSRKKKSGKYNLVLQSMVASHISR